LVDRGSEGVLEGVCIGTYEVEVVLWS